MSTEVIEIENVRADEVRLGNRLSIPGTELLSPPVRFIWHKDGVALFELEGGHVLQRAADERLRVVR